MTAAWQGERLRVGPLVVSLMEAAPWDPRPDWQKLRRNRSRLTCRLAWVRGLVPDLAERTGFPQPVRSVLGRVLASPDLAGRYPPYPGCC